MMILPIFTYGHPVLRRKALEVKPDFPSLNELIQNMWETMYHAKGVGLAAPQVGLPIRLFVVDSEQMMDEEHRGQGLKAAFINAAIEYVDADEVEYEEGCLSIPGINGKVWRPDEIIVRYQDESFEKHELRLEGLSARVVQHEYDHIEGILFTELLKPLKKRMLEKKLQKMQSGQVTADYPIKPFN